MYLGLDLRGGVHFLMQVDMKAALTKKADSTAGDVRTLLRDKNIRHTGIARDGNGVVVRFRDQPTLTAARTLLVDQLTDFDWVESQEGVDWKLAGNLKPDAASRVQSAAITQNITTLHNRVNELGVAEPVIQQQGADRVVVQLPGVQDTAKAKDIIGRTATLEMRMVDDSSEARLAETGAGPVPFGSERYVERGGQPLVVQRQVLITGENLTDAQPGFDGQSQEPAVHLSVDARGARIMRDVSRDNIGKRMAILLFEKGKGEVVTAPVIRGELGSRFQISGRMNTAEANDTALLLRAGSLAAPMEIIEERTIGPSLGAENIDKGFQSVIYGFAAIAALHVPVLPAVRRHLDDLARRQPAAPDRRAVDAAGDAHAARHRRDRAHARHGDRFQRPDQRAHPRGAARRRQPAGGDQHRLRARLRDHPRLERDHADRRPGAARLRLGADPRLRDRPLPGHRHVDVLGGDVLARPRQLLVRPPEAPEVGLDRPGLEARRGHERSLRSLPPRARPAWERPGARPTLATEPSSTDMEFFRIRRDIPFMRHALVFNIVSLLTFLAAVFFLATRGLHFSIEFTGGTVIETRTRSRPTSPRCAPRSKGSASATCWCRTSAARATS